MNEAQKAKAMSDKALKEAEQAKKEAKAYYERSQQANRERQEEALAKSKAKDEARSAYAHAIMVKMTYKTLFFGQMIFTLALAFFVAYGKRGVLVEMGKWFPDRLNDLIGVLKGLGSLFMALAKFPPAKWHIGAVWGYIFAIVVSLAVAVGVFFLCRFIKEKISGFWWNLKLEYSDGTFMAVISADIALVMLYVCLFFYEGLKKAFPLNILSIWIILSLIGVVAWNSTHIVKAVRK
ncbi:MAG: DUF6040 family protein [Brevinema sp.]